MLITDSDCFQKFTLDPFKMLHQSTMEITSKFPFLISLPFPRPALQQLFSCSRHQPINPTIFKMKSHKYLVKP